MQKDDTMPGTIAVMGADGFIGRTLTARLRDSGVTVPAYDFSFRRQARHPDDRGWDAVADAIAFPCPVDGVFYLAQSPFYRRFPDRADHLFGVNAYGAVKAARAAVDAGARFFCYASSGNVYRPSFEPLCETDPVRRDDGYALSKLAAEEFLGTFRREMPILSVRIFGAYGPGQQNMLVPTIAGRVRGGQAVTLSAADGETESTEGLRVSLIYVHDLVNCLLSLCRRSLLGEVLPPVLNLGGPEAISIRRLAESIGSVLGVAPVFEFASEQRSCDLIADVSRLQELVQPRFTDFEDALRQTLTDPKAHLQEAA